MGPRNAELAGEAGSATLRQRLGQQLRALKPPQRNALHRSLPISLRRLFTAALAAARAFANEQLHPLLKVCDDPSPLAGTRGSHGSGTPALS